MVNLMKVCDYYRMIVAEFVVSRERVEGMQA